MAYNFLRGDRDQPFLLAPDLRDWLPADHLAWFVRDVVDQLDLEPFLHAYRADGHGHPAYDPKTLLGVLLYAYAVGVRSSRQIQRRCREDLAFRVLAGNQLPDHVTIAHGEFVPGLSQLDSQPQILAYAFLFGIAQQLVTKLVDRQAQDILAKVPSKEPTAPSRSRPSPSSSSSPRPCSHEGSSAAGPGGGEPDTRSARPPRQGRGTAPRSGC
jgi:hypothetical protein